MTGQSHRRAAALLEVLGIYLAGPVLMIGIRRLRGVSLTNPLTHLTARATDAELLTASRQLFALLLFQNSGYYIAPVLSTGGIGGGRRRIMASPMRATPG